MASARASWLLALAFALAIPGLSSIPAADMPKSSTLWQLDKLIHAAEYGFFAALVFRALNKTWPAALLRVCILSIVLCGLFGVFDEIYQSTVPGRDSSPLDAVADLVGAVFATIVSAVLYSRQRSFRGHHSQL